MSIITVTMVGASGYVGAELTRLLINHNKIKVKYLLVSENSKSNNLQFSQLHPKWFGVCDTVLQSFNQQWVHQYVHELDAVFFCYTS